jgi:inorganic pyrophosphatase
MLEEEPTVNVFIEISKNSHIKYEYDNELKALVCDRILHTPFKYEFNYGFIPNTLSPDGDPLDVIVLMDDVLIPGSYIKCKFLGVLETEDDEGVDPKIIMCPIKKVDPRFDETRDIENAPPFLIEKIKYFFQHYKDLENKKVILGRLLGRQEAIQIYYDSLHSHSLHSNTTTSSSTS